MIRLSWSNPLEVAPDRVNPGHWWVVHPSSGAILAYCDTEAEAQRAAGALTASLDTLAACEAALDEDDGQWLSRQVRAAVIKAQNGPLRVPCFCGDGSCMLCSDGGTLPVEHAAVIHVTEVSDQEAVGHDVSHCDPCGCASDGRLFHGLGGVYVGGIYEVALAGGRWVVLQQIEGD